VHELVTEGNTLLQAGSKVDAAKLSTVLNQVRAMLNILGVDPLSSPWIEREAGNDEKLHGVLDSFISAELMLRQQAREHKDFATADAIRDRLAAAGIAIEDTADGARWTIAAEGDH
jgi:cysteinyl-tRNA synthetase